MDTPAAPSSTVSDIIDTRLQNLNGPVANDSLYQGGDPAARSTGLLSSTPANFGGGSDDAIQAKYNKSFDQNVQKLKTQQTLGAPQRQMKRLQDVGNLSIDQYQYNLARNRAIQQRKAMEDQQRSNVLTSVLGLGGAVGGAAIGGPVGAGIGAGVGTVAGSQMG